MSGYTLLKRLMPTLRPPIMSGFSSGSLVGSIVATCADAELQEMLQARLTTGAGPDDFLIERVPTRTRLVNAITSPSLLLSIVNQDHAGDINILPDYKFQNPTRISRKLDNIPAQLDAAHWFRGPGGRGARQSSRRRASNKASTSAIDASSVSPNSSLTSPR